MCDLLGSDHGGGFLEVTLEEIRMLSNLNEGKDNLLQIILAGQPTLKLKLERKTMRQFAQRVTLDYVLEPLEADETRTYIVYRMRVAGREDGEDLFTPTAYERIYQVSRGIPRLINILCDGALVYGFADELNTIDADVINEVVNDKKIRGQFHGNEPAPQGPAKSPAPSTLSRKHNALSRRVKVLEQQFKEFQDKRNDQTIQKLENLLAEEKERTRRAILECGQKDVIIRGLKQRVDKPEKQLRAQWNDHTKQRTEER